MKTLRIAMVQMNPTLGDLDGNTQKICGWMKEARRVKADVVVFPELAITGYPPEDLLLKPRFLYDAHRMVERIVRQSADLCVVVGCLAGHFRKDLLSTRTMPSALNHLYNAAAVISEQQVFGTYAKRYLPNYGVFDERRYFHAGHKIPVFVIGGVKVGVNICEDIWYPDGPTRAQTLVGGAELIFNINASPFQSGKRQDRERMLSARARQNGVWLSYTNMVGGQDELVFDGDSMLVNEKGEVIKRGKAFEEDFLVSDLSFGQTKPRQISVKAKDRASRKFGKYLQRVVVSTVSRTRSKKPLAYESAEELNTLEEIYRALVLGVGDYVRKNRFTKVLIGVSGGIDSALTAVIARDALGAENVIGVMMPSPYTSRASKEDARALAKELAIQLHTMPIGQLFRAYLRALKKTFHDRPSDTTEENLQARIRGNLLMALSNKFGHLVLTTGNKSEMSVGYATLYGDMAGGFAVIKDVPKTVVFDLARWRSQYQGSRFETLTIPQRIQDRPPSAELKDNQLDQDTLPPYPVLDEILKAYIEDDCAPAEISERGFPLSTVKHVIAMVDRSEYKRRQAPVGIKITPRALGKDRRMPITNQYPHS
ncbi:MAG: NAD+ synthase [Nitrospirales bacterium]|nr:NAD+ synthase [Nitrospira sp.]MDR4500348.1 NAD+ synthase [Nitrospirales bacterium]